MVLLRQPRPRLRRNVVEFDLGVTLGPSQVELPATGAPWGLIVERLKQYSETGKPNPLFAFATR
jgi:hypothetical protein